MKSITHAVTQLTTLGYQEGDRIFVRALVPKNIPMPEALKRGLAWEPEPDKIVPVTVDGFLILKGNNATFTRLKRCKESRKWIEQRTCQNGLAYLQQLNQKGYGIYYIVNAGGRENGDISHCPALFYECDTIGKDEQWQKVEELTRSGYEPSLVIETRNSLHVYHRTFEQEVEGWKKLQQRLIQHLNSDPSIYNENRLMRLAGFLHWKWNTEVQALESFPVTLKLNTGKVYSRFELNSLLPLWDVERWDKQASRAERVETDPSLDPWDIRNLATLLDGYNPNGRRGWITCKCPAHNGQSDNSLHIEQSTGAYKCHGGCDPKEIYHAALDLAKSRGYQVPQKVGHQFSDLGGWLFKLKRQLTKTIKRRNVWGVGRKGEVEVEPKPAKTSPAIEYQPSERLNVWVEAKKRGYKYILDTSVTGSGKSYDAGRATTELFGVRQLIYASAEHRNPTTSTLQSSWHDLEARHKGLVRDEFGKLRRASAGQPYVVAPNCGRNEVISALRSKNISGADTAGLICDTCPNLEPCQAGAVFGFLHDRMTALKQPRLRAHPESLPSPNADFGEPYNYSDVVLMWDEASEILKAHRSIEVMAADLQWAIADLAVKLPQVFDALRPLLIALHSYLSGEQKQPNKYGWKNAQIKAALPTLEGIDVNAIVEALAPSLDSLLDGGKEYGLSLADMTRDVRKRFSDSDAAVADRVARELALNWLPDFLDVLLGNVVGALRIQYGTLTITLPDLRLAEIARAASGNIFLDATATAEDLALVLGCDPSDILTVRQEIPDTSNLEIIQVATMGRLGVGSERSEFCQARVDAIVNQIQQDTLGKTGVIDFKRHTKEGDGKRRWWVDSRGVNDLEDCDALVSVGVPCRSLSDLEAEFTVLCGRPPKEGTERVRYPIEVNGAPSPDLQPWFEMEVSADLEFREFCRRRILADIHQNFGRLRASRRPGQQLRVYFIGDYPLDVPVTLKKASDITPDAATKPERVEMGIRAAVQQLKEARQKITQQAIAQITGLSQGYVSRFRKLLQTLLSSSNSKSNNSTDPPPDPDEVQWVSQEYLPLLAESPPTELLEEVLTTFEVYGQTVWRQIWDATPAAAQIKILQALMFTLSAGELRSLSTAAGVAA
ncbi:hypothetical protein Glo7428_5235 (plasmid) [Gloeocapsa sp. PCC 7428]|uniref:hypothetical protein n=1 Tax=Gloeocapsa sp. PCC 7428 TaxID=1173026 RepID=UPI0002A61C07|nr:hypothetical protein [Gloeocapsa sp. PCC 7428]AFZ33612.1 hypothetical protein Glo7428_5235 [Gloeocapsa sp. PCC 7428]